MITPYVAAAIGGVDRVSTQTLTRLEHQQSGFLGRKADSLCLSYPTNYRKDVNGI
jgi:hypothetical protein